MNGQEACICWIFLEVTKKITEILGNIESFEVDFRYQIIILFLWAGTNTILHICKAIRMSADRVRYIVFNLQPCSIRLTVKMILQQQEKLKEKQYPL
jgi:hypothetical protein